MSQQPRTLVLFDIDGTLLYSNGLDSNSFAQSYQEQYGIHFPKMDWKRFPHISDHTIFETIIKEDFGRLPEEGEVDRFQDYYVNMIAEKRKAAPDQYMEVPGAKRAMDELIAHPDYCVGIATGGWQRPATIKLQHLGFDTSTLFDSYADNKETREEILQEAIDKAKAEHGESIERIVYIGDAHWDVKTTRNMGLNFIGIRLKGDVETLHKEGADLVLQNFAVRADFQNIIAQARPPK